MTGVSADVAHHDVQSGRARGVAATIFGVFAVLWLRWGTVAAPELLQQLLRSGQVLAVVLALFGVVLTVRSPARSTPMTDSAVVRRYGIVVGVEFALLGVGNVILTQTGVEQWIPVWICAGVGVHFLPLARVFREWSLAVLAALISTVAVVAGVMSLVSSVASSTVVGAGAGLCLLLASAVVLIAKRQFTGLMPPERTAGS